MSKTRSYEEQLKLDQDLYLAMESRPSRHIFRYVPDERWSTGATSEQIQGLINQGASVNREINGVSPLMGATVAGDTEVMTLLLDDGAKIDEKCLMQAAERNLVEPVALLLDRGAAGVERALSSVQENAEMQNDIVYSWEVNKDGRRDPVGRHWDDMLKLLEDRKQINAQLINCTTSKEMADLVNRGANFNIQGVDNGPTTLMRATTFNDPQLIKLLISKGVRIGEKDMEAIASLPPGEVKDVLQEHQQHLDQELLNAARDNNVNLLSKYLELGANPNAQVEGHQGIGGNKTALSIATEQGYTEIMQPLLDHGARYDIDSVGTVWAGKIQMRLTEPAYEVFSTEDGKNLLKNMIKSGYNLQDNDYMGSPFNNQPEALKAYIGCYVDVQREAGVGAEKVQQHITDVLYHSGTYEQDMAQKVSTQLVKTRAEPRWQSRKTQDIVNVVWNVAAADITTARETQDNAIANAQKNLDVTAKNEQSLNQDPPTRESSVVLERQTTTPAFEQHKTMDAVGGGHTEAKKIQAGFGRQKKQHTGTIPHNRQGNKSGEIVR